MEERAEADANDGKVVVKESLGWLGWPFLPVHCVADPSEGSRGEGGGIKKASYLSLDKTLFLLEHGLAGAGNDCAGRRSNA